MSEIIIMKQLPVVFTKDTTWGAKVTIKPGEIIMLPADAVLYEPTAPESKDEQ